MLSLRRARPIAWTAALVVPLALGLVGPAASPAQARAACDAYGDIDAAIGVPGEAIKTTRAAGVVEVRYTCHVKRAPQALRLPTIHAGDAFGSSVARGRFNTDSYDDLAVGVPGLDVAGVRDAGGVAIFYGSKAGLTFGKLITQSSAGVPGAAQAGARFGAAIASHGYENWVLRIGEPGKTVSGHPNAGGFVDLPFVRGTITAAREVTLDSPGIPGTAGSGDLLGAAVAGSFSAGAPGKAVNGQVGAGAVLVSYLSDSDHPEADPATLLTQASPGISDDPEAGDHFGAALTESWVGVPGESIGNLAGAGMVQRYYYGTAEDNPGFVSATLVPGAGDIPGQPQAGAHFGAAVAETGFFVDDTDFRAQNVLIGAPGAVVAGVAGAGSVTGVGVSDPDIDGGSPFSLTGIYQFLTAPTRAAGAGFGSAITQLDDDRAAISAPGVEGGQVSEYVTGSNGSPALTLRGVLTQQAGRPEPGDKFGASLMNGVN